MDFFQESSYMIFDRPAYFIIVWGSLTKSGVFNLNLNLIKAPENVIDYIILHELCHLKIKEYSHHYWDLLHKYMPNYHDKIDAWTAKLLLNLEPCGFCVNSYRITKF